MRLCVSLMLFVLSFSLSALAQTATSSPTPAKTATSDSTKKRPPVFRANKEQVTQAQNLLKQKGLYAGEASGKLDDATRASIKKFQEGEKIRATGTLNRITLEKMNIVLTDAQKAIPVTETSTTPDAADDSKGSPNYFRAVKDQIMQAQKMLKDKGLYKGEESGKMNDPFRAAIRKYQEAEKIAVTGTLNRETIEKMGIPLTDKQKAASQTTK